MVSHNVNPNFKNQQKDKSSRQKSFKVIGKIHRCIVASPLPSFKVRQPLRLTGCGQVLRLPYYAVSPWLLWVPCIWCGGCKPMSYVDAGGDFCPYKGSQWKKVGIGCRSPDTHRLLFWRPILLSFTTPYFLFLLITFFALTLTLLPFFLPIYLHSLHPSSCYLNRDIPSGFSKCSIVRHELSFITWSPFDGQNYKHDCGFSCWREHKDYSWT